MHNDKEKLSDVHPDETFKAESGDEIKNLNQLLDVLNDISQDSFMHHVNDGKNDFANWIRNSVKDDELAGILERTLDFDKTKQIIKDRILLLEKRIEVSKIKENLESLKTDTIGIDKIPDDMQEPEKPAEEEKDSEEPDDTYDLEPKEAQKIEDIMEQTEDMAMDPIPSAPEKHPFEHLKENLHLQIRDILIGFLIGLVVGYLVWGIIF